MVVNETISVELVYIKPAQQTIMKLEVPSGSIIETVIKQSGLLKQNPEIDLSVNKVGIFSKVAELNHALNNGDRIEVYRSLQADPKEARRQRAKTNKSRC